MLLFVVCCLFRFSSFVKVFHIFVGFFRDGSKEVLVVVVVVVVFMHMTFFLSRSLQRQSALNLFVFFRAKVKTRQRHGGIVNANAKRRLARHETDMD